MTDDRWLRERMAAAVAAEPPAVDLAARAERTAGRIRRRRYGLAAGVAAVTAAVPLVLGGAGGTDRSLPPAGPLDAACQLPGQALPEQPDPVSVADVSWPLRGDPALRPDLERVMAGSIGGDPDGPPPVVRPLYAQRLAGSGDAVFVFAGRISDGAPWLVVARVLPADGTGDLDVAPGASIASARLPQLLPTTQVSLLVPVPGERGGPLPPTGWDRWGNLLVVLGAPGTDRVDYRACYRGRPFTVSGRGDVLVREVGPVDAPGRVEVWAGDQLAASGSVGTSAFGRPVVVLPAVEPVPAPAGTRVVQRLTGQGESQVPKKLVASVPAATLVARCLGPQPLEVAVGDRLLGPVPCDDRVRVLAEGVDLGQGRPLDVRGVPELRGGPSTVVAYDVVVVTAG